MKAVCAILLGLVAVVAAHYEGYPFVHKNEGRYGAKYPYANYKDKANYVQPRQYPAYHGVPYANHEYAYRQHGGFPVHVGSGQFYFLGNYGGKCDKAHGYGFYSGGNDNSFVVCDHGKAHRFQCPKGTRNAGAHYFQYNKAYGMNDLCGINTLKN